MLRGPQTPGELKTRTDRLHSFRDMGELTGTLGRLIERRLVSRLDRRPGQREERYRHLLSEDGAEIEPPQAEPAAPCAGGNERIERIERQLAELRAEIKALREELGT
jgi:uncharacterized protein YceH (UPF0502 family)